MLKTYEECWGEEGHIEKGNGQLKFLNSGAKLDIMSTIQRERESACVVGVKVERGAQELFMDSAVCISSGIGNSFYFFFKILFILLCWVFLVAYRI